MRKRPSSLVNTRWEFRVTIAPDTGLPDESTTDPNTMPVATTGGFTCAACPGGGVWGGAKPNWVQTASVRKERTKTNDAGWAPRNMGIDPRPEPPLSHMK